jgi:RimJ/RimL family protein N-acetyltransferase
MSQLEIKTHRLLLQTLNIDHAEAILRYHSDSLANKYQGWIPEKIEDVYDFIKNRVSPIINLTNTWHQLVIINRENNVLIGDIGLHFIDIEEKQVEIGFTLDKNYQGKGYATESLMHVIDYLFKSLNKHRIIASIDPENLKSISLVERLGFRKEAHFKKSLFINEKWVDDLIYAVLKDEWVEKNHLA